MKQFHIFVISILLFGFQSEDVRADIKEINFDNGTYIGETEKGVSHGYGTFYWNNGSKYEGNWTLGQMDGHGVFTSRSGEMTDVFYRHGKPAVDYSNLPEDYPVLVCSILTNLFLEDVDSFFVVSQESKVADNLQVVEVHYRTKPDNTEPLYKSECKFAPSNHRENHFDMIEGHVMDIHWTGKKAIEMGELAIDILFLPYVEDY